LRDTIEHQAITATSSMVSEICRSEREFPAAAAKPRKSLRTLLQGWRTIGPEKPTATREECRFGRESSHLLLHN
jgi:hypothetical protein